MSHHWNYRVVIKTEREVETFGLAEVYYDDAGQIRGWCDVSLDWETADELRSTLRLMLLATDKPALRVQHRQLVEEPKG